VSRIAITIPTIGRESLREAVQSLVPQLADGDRVMVVCDDMTRYDFCSDTVADAREAAADGVMWRTYPTDKPRGAFGHAGRNMALDMLLELEDAPSWSWSIDDDDIATPWALEKIRAATLTGDSPWYVFRMVGGAGSHYPGLKLPNQGPVIRAGNVGTPMLVFPVCDARWGTTSVDTNLGSQPDGYFGDYQMAISLTDELGQPGWVDSTVCEVRPKAEEA